MSVPVSDSARLHARRRPRWIVAVWVVLGVLGGGAVLLFGLAYFAWRAIERHVDEGDAFCEVPGYATQMLECSGRDHSFLQGRFRYSRAEGIPDKTACRSAWAGEYPPPVGGTATPVPCAPYGVLDHWRCVLSERMTASSDSYKLVDAFAPDCGRFVFLYGVNVAPEDISEKTAKLPAQPVTDASDRSTGR